MSRTIENLAADRCGNYILPFFWQHGEDEEVLRHYMRVIHGANIGAVCVESRPHPDFCGEKWWKDMDAILDEASSLGMKVWILDDSHFPTGFANGAMKDQPLSKAHRCVCCRKTLLKAGETLRLSAEELKHPDEHVLSEMESMMLRMRGKDVKLPRQADFADDRLIGISARTESGEARDLKSCILPDGSFSFTAERDCAVYALHATRNRGARPEYINMVDASSVRVLIDAVYEKHYEHYAKYFGNVIEGSFSDEPELGNGHMYSLHNELGIGFEMDYPWSDELEKELAAAYGGKLSCSLPLVWETQGDEEERARARYIYMDAMTRLAEKDFSFQVGDWCRAHGVKYIGHIIEDNGQHCRTGSTMGHYFRALRGQDWAGIDDIGGQVYPMGEDDSYEEGVFRVRSGPFYHFLLGKLASSLAAVDPRMHGTAMCEIFGAYGWKEGIRLEKYLADHFLVRGVNRYVPHAFSPKAFPDPDCPPHFYAHGHNPEYRAFGVLMKYMNRCCELLSGGRRMAPAAVVYHGEAEWMGDKLPDEAVARVLTEHQIEFDVVPTDSLCGGDGMPAPSVSDGILCVNTQRYGAVIAPYMKFVPDPLAGALVRIAHSGVPVWFAGGAPSAVIGGDTPLEDVLKSSRVCETDELPLLLRGLADVSLAPADRYMRFCHYVKDGADLYMFVNEGDKVYEGTVSFSPAYLPPRLRSAFEYDAWEHAFHETDFADGKCSLSLEPGRAAFLVFPHAEEDIALLQGKCSPRLCLAGCEASDWNKGWRRSTAQAADCPVFGEPRAVSLPDALAQEQPEFSGWVRYENSFAAQAGKEYALEIADAYEAVELYVNGQYAGTQAFAPYRYDITRFVRPGTNDVRIDVATTLERSLAHIPNHFGKPTPPSCGSGITGAVRILSR